MTRAMLGWMNSVRSGVLSASSSVGGMDVSQLQNDQGSSSAAWQSTGASAEWFEIDARTTVPWRALALFRTNLTGAATVQWTIRDAGGAMVLDTGVVAAGVMPDFGQSVTPLGSDVSGRYARCTIRDPGNPNGFINVPLAFAGPAWVPQMNISWDTTLGRDDQTDEVVSRGGQEYPTMRFVRRRWDVSFSGIRDAEVWPSAMALDAFGRTGGNVLFVPDPAGDVARETVFGRSKMLSDISWPYGSADRRAMKLRVSERL